MACAGHGLCRTHCERREAQTCLARSYVYPACDCVSVAIDLASMALSRVNTMDIILQAKRALDLRDRSLSSMDVQALAKLISTTTALEVLSLYNVKLNSDVSVCILRLLSLTCSVGTDVLYCVL